MKIHLSSLLALVLLAGCMSSAPKAPVNWTVEVNAPAVSVAATATAPKYGVARLAQVSVCAPYDGQKLVVLRPNGSVAFDGYNVFAASPMALLKGAAREVAEASGLFAHVVPSASSAAASVSLEISVTRLALDCRTPNTRRAACELAVTLLKGRDIVGIAKGDDALPVAGGDYSAAFSRVFATALEKALKGL